VLSNCYFDMYVEGCVVACRKKFSIWLAVQGFILAQNFLVQLLVTFCNLYILLSCFFFRFAKCFMIVISSVG
jgi:hypothetical protein